MLDNNNGSHKVYNFIMSIILVHICLWAVFELKLCGIFKIFIYMRADRGRHTKQRTHALHGNKFDFDEIKRKHFYD